jgi:hypothetical protein
LRLGTSLVLPSESNFGSESAVLLNELSMHATINKLRARFIGLKSLQNSKNHS